MTQREGTRKRRAYKRSRKGESSAHGAAIGPGGEFAQPTDIMLRPGGRLAAKLDQLTEAERRLVEWPRW